MQYEKFDLKSSYDLSREMEVVQELSENGIQTMYYKDADTSDNSQETNLLVNHEAFGAVCDWLIQSRQNTITSSNKERTWKRIAIVTLCVLVSLVIASAIAFPTMLDKKFSEGYASGKEYAAEVPTSETQAGDSEEVLPGSAENGDTVQSLEAVPFSNGEIILYPHSPQYCPLTIEVSGTDAYYIYLDSTTNSSNDMAFMVSPDSSAEVSVPLDVYEIYCAYGETWYGKDLKFGKDTIYSQCDGTFDFYDDGQYYQGWTLELYDQYDGNMDTEIISSNDFPG